MADNTAKILEDTVGVEGYDEQEYRIVQLSSAYNSYVIEQHIARMSVRKVCVTRLNSNQKPKEFGLTEKEMDTLVAAWTTFKSDLAILKATKEAEKLQQFKDTWAEIDRLANSVPGVEISTMDTTWKNHDTNEEMPHYEVKLSAIGFHLVRLTLPEKILDKVKEAVEQYISHLKMWEEHEQKDWYGCQDKAIHNGKAFLATHRAWVAHKEQWNPEEEKAFWKWQEESENRIANL